MKIDLLINACFSPLLMFYGKAHIFFYADKKLIINQISLTKNNLINYNNLYFKALVFAEDRRFYKHLGIDIYAILRAIYVLVWKNKIQGASTIEQQLVRTLIKDYRLSVFRKIKEQVLAIWLQDNFSKDEIIILYLNISYIGNALRDEKKSIKEIAAFVASIRFPRSKNSSVAWNLRFDHRRDRILKFLEIETI